jgi:2-polyprenyl-3-methyl-5-hydroxy-6-metoxy-1,4-benzoquinol methylase
MPTTRTPAQIREEFDRIARLPDGVDDRSDRYQAWLLRHLPARFEAALDVGCGTGALAVQLAERAQQVVGIDLSPEMIRRAQARTMHAGTLDFRCADVMMTDFMAGSFDVIVSVTAVHHLPLQAALRRLAGWLRPDGTLAIIDVRRHEPATLLLDAASALAYQAQRILRSQHSIRSNEAQMVWQAHGSGETYSTVSEVRRACMGVLPGAQVQAHRGWRYSLLWRKPAAG